MHWRETEREREMPHSTNKVGRGVPRQGSAEDLASTEGRKRDGEREREREEKEEKRTILAQASAREFSCLQP